MGIRIRRVDYSAHAEQLKALHAECFPCDSEPEWRLSEWWIAFENRKPVGFAGARLYEHDRHFYFTRAGVLDGWRGRGLQRRFIRARCARAAKLGAKYCCTYTTADNLHSANNLIECGFRHFTPARKWGGKSCLYFSKQLG